MNPCRCSLLSSVAVVVLLLLQLLALGLQGPSSGKHSTGCCAQLQLAMQPATLQQSVEAQQGALPTCTSHQTKSVAEQGLLPAVS